MTINEKLHRIKKTRLAPAYLYISSVFEKAVECYTTKYPYSTFYKVDNKVVFEYYNSKDIAYFKIVYSIFFKAFSHGCKYSEIYNIIGELAFHKLNINQENINIFTSNSVSWNKINFTDEKGNKIIKTIRKILYGFKKKR